jgi:hypothetical protein
MDNIPDQSGLSPWFLALPWICRTFGALIVTVLLVTLWTLLLFFNVTWWIILLTIIIPTIIYGKWQWYWCHQPDLLTQQQIIPAATYLHDVRINV